MNSSQNDAVDSFNTVLSQLYKYIGIPLYLFGNLGNLLSVSIFSQKPWRKNVCVFYFLISLLFNSININTGILGNIFIYGFNINRQNSSMILCKLFKYTGILFDALSATILVLASIDRLLISSQNVQTRLYSSKRLAYFSISISTIIWSIFFCHVLIEFDVYQLGPFISTCIFQSTGFYNNFLSYSLLMIHVLLVLLMVALSILSFKNVRQIRLVPRQQRQNIRSMHKKDFQLLRCLFSMNIVQIICSILLAAYAIYKVAINGRIQTPWEQARDNFLFNLSNFIHFIPYCVSFIIYIILSKAFRRDFKRIVWKICGKNLVVVTQREEEKEQEINRDNVELDVVSAIVLRSKS